MVKYRESKERWQPGADLLVDGMCFPAAYACQHLPALGAVGATVMLSSNAVNVDQYGNQSNSDVSPRFEGPRHACGRTS